MMQDIEDADQGESIHLHVTSQRGDDFHINPQSRNLKEVIAAIATQLPDVQELSVRGGADQELVTAENQTHTLQSPVVIEYALRGGGVMVPETLLSLLDLCCLLARPPPLYDSFAPVAQTKTSCSVPKKIFFLPTSRICPLQRQLQQTDAFRSI
jgi:hypothetical protein